MHQNGRRKGGDFFFEAVTARLLTFHGNKYTMKTQQKDFKPGGRIRR